MLKILGQNTGGSGTGMSYYTAGLGCIRRDTLAKKTGLDGDETKVGTYMHHLLEDYYRDPNAEPQMAVEFASLAEDPDANEALKLFSAYRKYFPADEFRDVVGIEPQAASNEEEADKLATVFGAPFTARFDMVVRLDEKDADFCRALRNIDVEPGLYLVDHKTKKNRSHLLVPEMMLRPQFAAYQHAWNVLHEEKCKGVIVNVMVRHKDPDQDSFISLLVPPPNDTEIQMVKDIVRDGAAARALHGPMWANPAHCLEYFRLCPFLLNGDCDRTNHAD